MPHHDIPPPANWEDLEDLCLDLWRLIWADTKARKHGRRGQPQAGVDVYGQPKNGPEWEGVQCKLKSQILDENLTRKEIEDEVTKARTFRPALAAFTLATTAPRDTRHLRAWKRLERRARTAPLGVPKLPSHYLERSEYLRPLRRAILHQIADKLGITGKGAVGVQVRRIGKTALTGTDARQPSRTCSCRARSSCGGKDSRRTTWLKRLK